MKVFGKVFLQSALALAMSLQLSACGDKGSTNDNSGTTALSPQTNLQACAPQNINQYANQYPNQYANSYQNGYPNQPANFPYSPYPWNTYNTNQNAFSGCPQGQIAACQPNQGLYCVTATNLQPAWYTYNTQQNNFSPYAGYNLNAGQYGVGRICQVGVLGTCGNFGNCAVTNYPYGICTN